MITMFEKMYSVKERLLSRLHNEKGAVAFEYVLILGGVSAVIVTALALGAPSLFTGMLNASAIRSLSFLILGAVLQLPNPNGFTSSRAGERRPGRNCNRP